MNVIEEKIKHLDNKPPKFERIQYPVPIKANIQAPYYCCVACGIRGSGKTYIVVKMLRNSEQSGFINPVTGGKVAIRTVLFSQTIQGNPIFKTLKSLDEEDMFNDYSEARLQELLDELKANRDETEERHKYIKAFNTFKSMSQKEFNKWTDVDAIMLLEQYDFSDPRELPPVKYPHGLICNIILDDVLSNKEAFSSKKSSLLNRLVLNGRHYQANVIICAQNLKAINKSIRQNTQVWFLFKTKSLKVLIEDIYQDLCSNILTEEQFLKLYEAGTIDDHSCFTIDEKDEKQNRFKRNLDVILKLE
jgi:hypothetical protein